MPTSTMAYGCTIGATALAHEVTITTDAVTEHALVIPDSTSDQLITIAIDFSELEALYLFSDQDVTIETNDGTTPDDTFSLVAGVPIAWNTDCGHDNPLTADVTAMYITNATGETANVKIRVAQDSTP